MAEEHELPDYEQAMDDVLAELGVPKGLATTVDLELADKTPLVDAVRERQAAWGDAWADAMRGVEMATEFDTTVPDDAERFTVTMTVYPWCAYCSHPHHDHMHDNPRRLCRRCMCIGYELPAGSG